MYKSFLPAGSIKKKIKHPVVGMCRRCGTEFFSNKEKREHIPTPGCGHA